MIYMERQNEPVTLYLREIKTCYEELFSLKAKPLPYLLSLGYKNLNKSIKNEKVIVLLAGIRCAFVCLEKEWKKAADR